VTRGDRRPVCGTAAAAALLLLVVACGGATSPNPQASPTTSADASGPAPKPTHWPTSTIEGTIALGAADTEIWKAGVDLRKAAESEDLELMLGAADGLAKLLEGNLPNVPRLQSYPATKDLGDGLEISYAGLLNAAVQIRDSITGGDSNGLLEGFTKLTAAIELYAVQRQALAEAAIQAVFMKRVLNL
jgi:hypothetical protein